MLWKAWVETIEIVKKLNNTPWKNSPGRHHLHQPDAVLGWTVGAVAGLVVQLLIQSNMLLRFLADGSATPASALALSLLAGLSELFFPTLLRQFDQSVDGLGERPNEPVPEIQPAKPTTATP